MIINRSRKQVIVEKKHVCRGLSKAIGLMFSTRNKIDNCAFIFEFSREKKLSFHMFFVFYPVDIVFLDRNKRVVEYKQGFKPFTAYCSKEKAKFAIELPENSAKLFKVNDILEW